MPLSRRRSKIGFWQILFQIPYPLQCNPGVLFFKIDFWVGVYSKIPFKKWTFTQKLGFIQEKSQKLDFSYYLGLYSRLGLQSSGCVLYLYNLANLELFFEHKCRNWQECCYLYQYWYLQFFSSPWKYESKLV